MTLATAPDALAPASGPAVLEGPRQGRLAAFVSQWGPTLGLIAALLIFWEVAARTFLSDSGIFPPLSDVVPEITGNLDLWQRHVETTLAAALKGWLVGNLVATALGVLAVIVGWLEKAVLQLAVAVSALPIIAVAPLLQVTLNGDAPRATLAGMAVFFTTLIGTIVGLRAADRRSLDVVRALGGGSITAFTKVRIRAALPDYVAALKISAPAAILGAIVGEFIGRTDRGLGIALIAAQSQAQIERVWAVAFVSTAVAGAGYALIALVGRLATPWAPRGRDPRTAR